MIVISLGGSLIVPDSIDVEYLRSFKSLILELLSEDPLRKFILVTGGGRMARNYQNAFYNICGNEHDSKQNYIADLIGIAATRLNGCLVKSIFAAECLNDVVTDPTSISTFEGRILVAAGWKPGFSTDNDAVYLAKSFNAKMIINFSNIEKVYTADPKSDANARGIDKISWEDFRKITGNVWTPGKNLPFDPVASKNAQEAGLTVVCTHGKNLDNLRNIIRGNNYTGTTISG